MRSPQQLRVSCSFLSKWLVSSPDPVVRKEKEVVKRNKKELREVPEGGPHLCLALSTTLFSPPLPGLSWASSERVPAGGPPCGKAPYGPHRREACSLGSHLGGGLIQRISLGEPLRHGRRRQLRSYFMWEEDHGWEAHSPSKQKGTTIDTRAVMCRLWSKITRWQPRY